MTPEEKFNNDVWYVLKKIKERWFYTKQTKPIEYQVRFSGYQDPDAPSPDNEVETLEKLQEWNAIRIRNRECERISEYISPEIEFFYLEILQPKFDELYRLYGGGSEGEAGEGWLHIKKFLPSKLDVEDIAYDEKLKKVVAYIEDKRKGLLYEGKIPEKTFIFFAPISNGIGSEITDFNVGKFLVLLERMDIVEGLHLPIFVKETKNKEVIEIKSLTPVWFSSESAVEEALQSPEEFRNKIPRLKIRDWKKFLEVKKQLRELEEKRKVVQFPIRKTALQNIAAEIKELTTHSGLTDFLGDFNVPEDPSTGNSKYDRVFSALSSVNQETLFKIIEEAVHPLRFFGGDEEMALQMQDLFSSFLQFDGYCFQNGKIVRATPKLLKEVKTRAEKRKEKPVNQISNNIGTMPIREPFPIRIVGETEIKGLEKGLKSIATKNEKTTITKGKKYPKSIYLISTSLEPQDAVWLVFEEKFEMPKRFAVWNKKGEATAVKKLYDIAYEWDVPNKMINYDERVADNINNGLFKNRWVAKYMKTNKLEKPTLVQKSEKGTLVLKNEIPVKTGLTKNVVPLQYQSLYTDKTK